MSARRTLLRVLSRFHTGLYQVSGGRLGTRIGHLEQVLLTTTGRRTGARRTVPLLGIPHEDGVLLVASAGGSERHPDWYLNVLADPEVVLRRGRRSTRMHARPADPVERAAWWPVAVATFDGYRRYQERTAREIPVVVCRPVSES
ncbi:MAG: nitroreductase family deazaflavin-dependent oxidoreductase [Actinomycetales bacterium]|nr:nitroreductase family deazaflavin-dependent oxidoreductase [Actinomycetales bacterium]